MSGSWRLFLALELSAAARETLAEWAAEVRLGVKNQRSVATDALHVTLVFLGATPPEKVEPIWDAARAAAAGHREPLFESEGVQALPLRRPTLLALALSDDGRAAALQGDLADALDRQGLHARERRPFWPHVTLVRFQQTRRLEILSANPLGLPWALAAPALALYRSDPSAGGARYAALERLELPST